MADVVLFVKSRLLLHGIEQLLRDDHHCAVTTTGSFEALLCVASAVRPDFLVFELDESQKGQWPEQVATLRRSVPMAHLVGLSCSRRVDREVAQEMDVERVRRFSVVSSRDSISDLLNVLGLFPAEGPADWTSAPPPRPSSREALTRRELEVLQLLGSGLTTLEIGRSLQITTKTVENHKQHVYAKLGVQNQSHAVAVAVRKGIIPLTLTTDRSPRPGQERTRAPDTTAAVT